MDTMPQTQQMAFPQPARHGLSRRKHLRGTAALIGSAVLGTLRAGSVRAQEGEEPPPEEMPLPPAPETRMLAPATIEFWGPDPKTFAPMNLVAESFKAKYPQLDLVVGGGSLNITPASQEKFLVSIIAGTPPEVSYIDRYIPRSYAVMKALVPLDERIRGSKINPEEWWPYLRNDVTQDGQIYGLPIHTDARLFSWNKEYFRELGLNSDQPPATWDDITNISARMVKRDSNNKLTRAGFMPWGGGFGTHGLPYFLHLWQAGGDTLDFEERRPRFHEPPGVRALEWMMAVARQIGGKDGYAELVTDMPTGTGLDPFSTGRLGMQIHGTGGIYMNYMRNVPNLRFGLAEVPIPRGGQPSSYTGGFAICMAKNARQPDAGWAFMEHWLSDEMQFAWPDATNFVPTVRRIAESEEFVNADPVPELRMRELANKGVSSARWVPTRPGSDELITLWIDRLVKASELKQSAQDLLGDMARQTQVILDKWLGKYGV